MNSIALLSLLIIPKQIVFATRNDYSSERKANDTLLVITDPDFIYSNHRNINHAIKEIIQERLNKYLDDGTVNVIYNTERHRIKDDLTAIFSISSCKEMWRMYENFVGNGIIFVAITEPDCARLPQHVGTTLPLYETGSEITQLILDLRTRGGLDWESVTLVHDSSISDQLIMRIIQVISKEIPITKESCSISIYKIETSESDVDVKRNKDVYKTIASLPPLLISSNFMVLVKKEIIPTVYEAAKSVGLIDPTSKWLFISASSYSSNPNNIYKFNHLIEDGENVAFIYNFSDVQPYCLNNLLCHAEEMLGNLAKALEYSLEEEIRLSELVSDEEWEITKPTKQERRATILNFMKNSEDDHGKCDNCTIWNIKSSETWGMDYDSNRNNSLLSTGFWSPKPGPVLIDEIFPNIAHGFRGRTIPIATFHYPPWQVIKYDDSGKPSEYTGVTFQVINELANSLNFTYIIIVISNRSVINSVATNTLKDQKLGEVILDAKLETSAWKQAKKLLDSRRVLIAAAAFTVTEDRKRDFNFSYYISIEPYALLVSRPNQLSRTLLFILPFSSDTWFCIIGAILIMTPVLCFVHRRSPYYNHFSHREKGGFSKMMNSFWYLYGALLQQGLDLNQFTKFTVKTAD